MRRRGARCALICAVAAAASCGDGQPALPDGLYASVHTSKGTFVGRLEPELTPLTVTSFVGLAEGTIDNAAFDPGRPFFDGSVYHRVVPGHVIQAGIPDSDRADGPGYQFPNEIHASLSHDHAGALNMANGGPHTNAAQFCVTLGDRSYLDGDYIVFGEVVEGMDVVFSIEEGDVIDSVRVVRVGREAQAFRADTETFERLRAEAAARVAEHAERREAALRAWIEEVWPGAAGPEDGVRTEILARGEGGASPAPKQVRYRGTQVRYLGHVVGREGPPLELTTFGSGDDGVPGFVDPPRAFTFTPGESELVAALAEAIGQMAPGERRAVVIPAAHGYGSSGLYPPETPGQPRFVISPDVVLVYEVEVLG